MNDTTSRRRRHCMVVHAYYPVGETRVQREAAALVDRGFQVDVLCLRGAGEAAHERVDGVGVFRLPVARHRGRGLAVQLAEYLVFLALAGGLLTLRHLRRRYDAVQVHNLPDFLVFAAAVPKVTGTPVLLDLHDLMPEFFADRAGVALSSPLVRVVRLQERLACRFADHVITVTDCWRDALVGRGVPADKVSVVMNLADPRLFRRQPPPKEQGWSNSFDQPSHRGGRRPGDAASEQDWSNSFDQPSHRGGGRPGDAASEQDWSNSFDQPSHPPDRGGLRLLYHGTFTHRYGVDLLLEAAALVRQDVPGLRVRLLGAGELREQLVEQRARLGLHDCVDIAHGMLDARGLPAAIREADAGVVPNRSGVFTDGLLPTKLLELVAMGTPVLAARTPTIASYFDDDVVEFFTPGDAVALADAIRRLAADPARRRTLADNADAFNRKYDWASAAAGYAATVDAAIAARNGRPSAQDRRRLVPPRRRSPSPRAKAPAAAYRVRMSAAPDDPVWDAFLAATPGGHHTQTSLWAQVKASMGWQAVRVVAEHEGRIAGGAQILHRRVAPWVGVGYVSRGPVLADGDPRLAAAVVGAVEQACRELSLRHLVVQPPGDTEAAPAYLRGRGYLPSSAEVAPRATILLEVTPDPDEILAGMGTKTRYNVRLSGRRGVTVREGGADDIAAYHRLLQSTAARQGFSPLPLSYFQRMWQVLAPAGHLRLSLAEVQGEVLAGQLAVAFGDTVVNKLSVWSGQAGNRRPNEAVQWAAIRWAHAHGYRWYDLEGLKLKVARAVVAGQPLPDSAGQTVASFKLGFGGRVVVMPAAQVHVPNRAVRWAFAQVYPRVGELRSVKAVVKGVRTRAGTAEHAGQG